MLTGREIFESGIIVDALEQNIQQQGVDIRVSKISKVSNSGGVISVTEKTKAPQSSEMTLFNDDRWILQPGYYEVEFVEGCNLPDNIGIQIKTRSSLVRCGSNIFSGHFDPGFRTDHMGAFLRVDLPITIYKDSRLAQVLTFESNRVENTYDGQWQEDKQRNNKSKNDKVKK